MTSSNQFAIFCLSFVIFLILMTKDRQTWHFNKKKDKSEEFANVNFSLFVWVSGLLIVVTEVTRISVRPLYFTNHTPTVLYNQKYKEYEITKNVEISTK